MAIAIEDCLLTPGGSHSRPGTALKPEGVVIHYIGNAGTSARNNRNWFENGGASASAHYLIGLEGEILRCIPENEVAWHAGKSYGAKWDAMAKTNNYRFLGIETCHPTADGHFNEKTYNSLVELTADICKRHNFDPEKDVYRHYDVCGKNCPLYYVNNPREWTALKNRIIEKLAKLTADTPSGWAAEAWKWAKQQGITDGTRPAMSATREECITFIYRLYNLLKNQ